MCVRGRMDTETMRPMRKGEGEEEEEERKLEVVERAGFLGGLVGGECGRGGC